MVVVDSNVFSELMRPAPSPKVKKWLDDQRFPFTTAITRAEILHGLELMPPGKRRHALVAMANRMFDLYFLDRVLPFDSDAAGVYSALAASRRRQGRPISQLDAQIASIARTYGAALATRDTDVFEDCGIQLIDPWLDS